MWDYKDIGGLATVEITKRITPDGKVIALHNPEFLPTFVSSSKQKHYRVVPLKEAGRFGLADAENKYNEIMHHMTQLLKK